MLNESEVGKIHNFQPVSCSISETVQYRTKVTINDNRKSHAPFRLVPKSATLDDPEWLIFTVAEKIVSFQYATGMCSPTFSWRMWVALNRTGQL